MINDTLVKVELNENGHYRGLHIAVINPETGKTSLAKAFDTYESSKKFDTFISINIPKSHIVVAVS